MTRMLVSGAGILLLMMTTRCSDPGAAAGEPHAVVLTDFGSRGGSPWVVVNDDVMGGRSTGGFEIRDATLRFAGSTNTDGGGFSSIRWRPGPVDLSAYAGVRLRVRGDGRSYTFRLTNEGVRHRGEALPYRADFQTGGDGAWRTVDLPFADFRPRWRGRSVRAAALDPTGIDSLGIQIYDRRDGPFWLEVDWIGAYRAPPAFSMAGYRWKKRPLLVFAPSRNDPRLGAQLSEVARSRARFDERDMVLVVVLGEGTSRAGDRLLNPAEAASLRAAYGVAADAFAVKLVGKDGGVKRSDGAVVEPSTLYALIDTMPMRQREMRQREMRRR